MPTMKIKVNGEWQYISSPVGSDSSGSGSIELDKNLTIEGMAADAKAVGDAIEALRQEILGGSW